MAILQEAETERTIAIWLKHKILRDEWVNHQPQPGDRIGIKYLEEQQGRQGNPYHAYIVRVEKVSRQDQAGAEAE